MLTRFKRQLLFCDSLAHPELLNGANDRMREDLPHVLRLRKVVRRSGLHGSNRYRLIARAGKHDNGARQVSRTILAGAARVAKYIAAFSSWYWDGVDVGYVTANGQAGAVLTRDGKVLGVVTLSASADGIEQLMWVMNPAKLHRWQDR